MESNNSKFIRQIHNPIFSQTSSFYTNWEKSDTETKIQKKTGYNMYNELLKFYVIFTGSNNNVGIKVD